MNRKNLITVMVGFVCVVALSQDAFARYRMYNPALGVFMQRDPVGTTLVPPMARNLSESQFTQPDPTRQYQDGMNLYQYVRSNPVVFCDPSGLRVFFTKSNVKEANGSKTGNIVLYDLLRYIPGECCVEKWGKQSVGAKLKETAAAHAKVLEDFINKGNYTYNDGEVTWNVQLKVIITTDTAYSLEDHLRARDAISLTDESDREDAKYQVLGRFGAYSKVTVVCKERDDYDLGTVPAEDPKWKRITYAELLAHELIGHHLNNNDEINRGKLLWADDLTKRLGHAIENDSIMTYNNHAGKFYDRHFAAGIDDVNNISGKKDLVGDNTSLLDLRDPWFSRDTDVKTGKYALEMVRQIVGIIAPTSQAVSKPARNP